MIMIFIENEILCWISGHCQQLEIQAAMSSQFSKIVSFLILKKNIIVPGIHRKQIKCAKTNY